MFWSQRTRRELYPLGGPPCGPALRPRHRGVTEFGTAAPEDTRQSQKRGRTIDMGLKATVVRSPLTCYSQYRWYERPKGDDHSRRLERSRRGWPGLPQNRSHHGVGFALDFSMRAGDESMTSMGEPMWRRSRRVGNWLSSSSGPQQPMPLCEAGSCVHWNCVPRLKSDPRGDA